MHLRPRRFYRGVGNLSFIAIIRLIMKSDITPNPAWERLSEVIDYSGLSVNAFAKAIGLKRGENLYQIKKGNNGISPNLAKRINQVLPCFSVAWLISGRVCSRRRGRYYAWINPSVLRYGLFLSIFHWTLSRRSRKSLTISFTSLRSCAGMRVTRC